VASSITACIVHHNTPRLLRAAAWSLRSLYPDLPIVVVESGSAPAHRAAAEQLASEIEGLSLITHERNVHHGPGLDIAIRSVEARRLLLFDSDCIAFRGGFLEEMEALADADNAYMVGEKMTVDRHGFNVERGLPYIHPKCALLDRKRYLELPPFALHGAPCLANEIAAAERRWPLVHFPVDQYVFHLGRGTVRDHGYSLGWRSRGRQLLRRLRSLLPRR
jgi:hypothetical protein